MTGTRDDGAVTPGVPRDATVAVRVWIEEADPVTFTYFGAKDGDCSGDPTEQNDEIINLGDGFTFDIEGQTLTIYGRFSETGLEYRATSPE